MFWGEISVLVLLSYCVPWLRREARSDLGWHHNTSLQSAPRWRASKIPASDNELCFLSVSLRSNFFQSQWRLALTESSSWTSRSSSLVGGENAVFLQHNWASSIWNCLFRNLQVRNFWLWLSDFFLIFPDMFCTLMICAKMCCPPEKVNSSKSKLHLPICSAGWMRHQWGSPEREGAHIVWSLIMASPTSSGGEQRTRVSGPWMMIRLSGENSRRRWENLLMFCKNNWHF